MSFSAERINLAEQITSHDTNQYWKLRLWNQTVKQLKEELSRLGYATGKCKDAECLQESLLRAQLGQTSYVECSNAELRAFIAARKIEIEAFITPGTLGLRSQLIKRLDYADQNPTFPKFMSLPPELRNRIYEMHFASFEHRIPAPVQPPLTLVSSQVRQETVQMFYRICSFSLIFYNTSPNMPPLSAGRGRWAWRLRVPSRIVSFVHSLKPEYFASIGALSFGFTRLPPDDPDPLRWGSFPRGGCYWFTLRVPRTEHERFELDFGDRANPTSTWSRIEAAIEGVVDSMNKRPSKVGITMDDVYALRSAMETT